MNSNKKLKRIHGTLAIIAILFGLATILSGFMVLLEVSDPGFTVFLPLLIFNILMGFIYLIAAWFIWKNLERGFKLSRLIAYINLGVLIMISALFMMSDNLIAIDSIYAMSFRTFIWFGIYYSIKFIRG